MEIQKKELFKRAYRNRALFVLVALSAIWLIGCGAEDNPAVDKDAQKDTVIVKKEENKVVEKEEKPKKEEVERNYYVKNVQPGVDSAIKEYDDIWTALWVPTFTALGEGDADAYGAYGSMQQLEMKYKDLMSAIDVIDGKKLSKENKKLLKEFKREFKEAAMMRKAGGEEARKMIDKGDFSPSEVDKVMSTVQIADRSAARALNNKVNLEDNLKIVE